MENWRSASKAKYFLVPKILILLTILFGKKRKIIIIIFEIKFELDIWIVLLFTKALSMLNLQFWNFKDFDLK